MFSYNALLTKKPTYISALIGIEVSASEKFIHLKKTVAKESLKVWGREKDWRLQEGNSVRKG